MTTTKMAATGGTSAAARGDADPIPPQRGRRAVPSGLPARRVATPPPQQRSARGFPTWTHCPNLPLPQGHQPRHGSSLRAAALPLAAGAPPVAHRPPLAAGLLFAARRHRDRPLLEVLAARAAEGGVEVTVRSRTARPLPLLAADPEVVPAAAVLAAAPNPGAAPPPTRVAAAAAGFKTVARSPVGSAAMSETAREKKPGSSQS